MNQEQITKRDDTIKVGKKLKVEFTNITHDGMGICKINGENQYGETYSNFPLFVLGALPNEEGIVEIEKLHKTYGYAKLIRIFPDKTSKYRTTPICKHYPECGGCNIMHMDYKYQLEFKTKMVKDTLRKIGNIDNVDVLPTIGMSNPDKYRNKVQVPFRKTYYKTICGFFAKDSHDVVPLTECLIQPDISTSLTHFVRNLCNEFKIDGYVENNTDFFNTKSYEKC